MMKNATQCGGRWNRLKNLWREDLTALGVLMTIPSPQVVQVIARAELDFLFIDMEHGHFDPASLHATIAATAGTSLVPIVRVGANEPWLAKIPLDAGALGIIFPGMNTRSEAESAVKAVRYPPQGERFWGPFYAAPRWGATLPEYAQAANDEVLAIGMAEHIDVTKTIQDVVAVPGLDLLFIGPGDLAASMGYAGQNCVPEVAQAIGKLEAAILGSPVVLGGVAVNPGQAKEMSVRGYRALIVGFDCLLLERGLDAVLQSVRR